MALRTKIASVVAVVAAAVGMGACSAHPGQAIVTTQGSYSISDLETATARWVDWYNRTRPHLTNDDDLPPTTVEHRYNHNHTTTPPTTV